MRPKPALAILVLSAALAADAIGAEGFKFSEPDDADRAESEARQDRIADQLSTPCRADLKGKKIMVVIGETRSNGVISRAAAELWPAFPGDQHAAARARAADVHAGGDPQADRAGRDRRLLSERPGRRAGGVQETGRELRAARPDLVASRPQSADERQPGVGEHGFHPDRQQRQDHLRRAGAVELVRGRRRRAHGADARQRKRRRGGGQAVCGLLHAMPVSPVPRRPAPR